jgi:hypothetical protein
MEVLLSFLTSDREKKKREKRDLHGPPWPSMVIAL